MNQPPAIVLRAGFVVLAIGVSLAKTPADARTWRVTPDGTGDAPTLMAVMDSVSAGDTVLVAPGEFVITTVGVPDAVVVIGEEGPLETRIIPYGFHVLSGFGCGDFAEVSGLWFDGFRNGAGIGAVNVFNVTGARIYGCVFTNNEFGISLFASSVTIENNTFVGNNWALYGRAGGWCHYNIIWDPVQDLGAFVTTCNDVLRLEDVPEFWRPANFSADPQFCGADDFRIMTTSPCTPGNSPLGDNCLLIGALPVFCTPTVVEQRTWGQIKALYGKEPR
jgi:parallel beta-helix repeat protein